MKILHVTQNYFPSVGGPQYIVKHLSEKLIEYYGDNVEVCTTNSYYGPEAKFFKKIEPAVETIDGVKISRLPFIRWHYPLLDFTNKVHAKITGKPLPYSITKKRWALDSPAINKMMATTNADVIMVTTIIYNFADYPLWRFRTNNPKPFVLYGAVHLHKKLEPNSPFISRAKCCDCYIANTEFERQELMKYGIDGEKIITIGIGINVQEYECARDEVNQFRRHHNIEEDDVLIGFVGRLVKGKGVEILINAFRKIYVNNKKVKLLLAGGTTEYVPEIKRVIEEERLPIILIENFKDDFKRVLYNALDIFVLASQSESFGIVFLEAWSCKKPVIGTRMGAIASLLSDGKDSLLFNAGDINDLVKQLDILINNRELCNQLGANGYAKVIENYGWPVIIERYRIAYKLAIHNFQKKYNLKKAGVVS
jgi:glycosyltransferase involved in cell wall biosynthesis